jgi:general L-amino acid transport system permease protein
MTVDTTVEPIIRPPAYAGPLEWVRKQLFSTWYNGLLTLLSLAFLYTALRGVLRWVLFEATWDPVARSVKLFAVGQYPMDALWRPGAVVLMVALLMGVSWRTFGGTVRTFALALGGALGVAGVLPVSMAMPLRLGFLGGAVLVGVGYLIGRWVRPQGRWVTVAWLLSFPLALMLLRGLAGSEALPRVTTNLWGGLMLTFLLALVGITASFPIGVLLALGRRSKLPVVKSLCILFIELVRGVPLVTILFMASIILPLFLPENVRIDRVLRAMTGMTLFAAAYMAENVRGGLQSISRGQEEAAKALGLKGFQTMALIILPQALRAVIPTIVGQFIALFMDTTLAVIVGLVELLAVGRIVLNSNPAWLFLDTEVYLFIAAVFWVFTFSMSYASRRLEAALGVGER